MANLKLNWENIVGSENVKSNRGYFGDLMAVGNQTLEPMVQNGALTQEAIGMMYSGLVDSSMSKAIEFEKAQSMLTLDKIGSGKI